MKSFIFSLLAAFSISETPYINFHKLITEETKKSFFVDCMDGNINCVRSSLYAAAERNTLEALLLTRYSFFLPDAHLSTYLDHMYEQWDETPDMRKRFEISSDSNAHTLLHFVAAYGSSSILEELLQASKKANIDRFVEIKGSDNQTPLHAAARYHQTLNIKTLVKWNAEVNALTNEKWTPLHLAIFSSFHFKTEDAIKELIASGADINAQTNKGITPLHLAVLVGNIEVVRLLLTLGANYHLQDSEGYTPDRRAVIANQREIAELILRYHCISLFFNK